MTEVHIPGGVLRYLHLKRRLGTFWGLKILIFNIFGVFRRINIFWGMQKLWMFFFFFFFLGGGGGHYKTGLFGGSFLHFRAFS